MRHKDHTMHHRRHFPFSFFIFGMFFMLFFGWKLFFFVPLFLMFAIFGGWCRPAQYTTQAIEIEKPKRKPKNDNRYDGDYI